MISKGRTQRAHPWKTGEYTGMKKWEDIWYGKEMKDLGIGGRGIYKSREQELDPVRESRGLI